MGDYSHILEDSIWSYSRINAFETCPYKFFASYLMHAPKETLFFSSYGSFVHEALELFYKGELTADDLPFYYLSNFSKKVSGFAPSESIRSNYRLQGLECMLHPVRPAEKILAVEQKLDFRIGRYAFTGVIDLLLEREDGGLVIWDNKSRALKPRSGRAKPTKTDQELDKYLRQLYIYAAAVEQSRTILPSELVFYCYRTGTIIREKFDLDAYFAAKQWAEGVIDTICTTKTFLPSVNFYFCKNLCDIAEDCEYFLP